MAYFLQLCSDFVFPLSPVKITKTNVFNMGGWDINCSLCGASFNTFDAFNEEYHEVGEAYNRDVISEQGREMS